MVEEEYSSATLQSQDRMDRSSSAAVTQQSSHMHHASCLVAVDATAGLVPSDMLPGKDKCSSSEQQRGKEASSSPSDGWANEVIQVTCRSIRQLETSVRESGQCLPQCDTCCLQ